MTFTKRNSERKRVSQPAKIYRRDFSALCRCVVQDLSDTGARIKVEKDESGAVIQLPTEFILSFTPDEEVLSEQFSVTRKCRTVWARKDEVGVRFLLRNRNVMGAVGGT